MTSMCTEAFYTDDLTRSTLILAINSRWSILVYVLAYSAIPKEFQAKIVKFGIKNDQNGNIVLRGFNKTAFLDSEHFLNEKRLSKQTCLKF